MALVTDPTLIKARFPKRKAKLFGAGNLNHLILGVLRKAERPMSLEEIVRGVVADAGWDEAETLSRTGGMAEMATTEREWAERAARHLKAEMKRAGVTYDGLADRLKSHGFAETKASIANKLARATVPAAFFLACLAALELEGVQLEQL